VSVVAPTPELSARIQQWIDALPPKTGGVDISFERVCKDELDALPLYSRSLFLWAIRADGEVLCVDYEPFRRPVEPERDRENICTALFHGMRRYPELQELFEQVRPEGFCPCEECGGTGGKVRGDGTHDACWTCGLRGWVTRSRAR
jgi:hypothetical protein